MLFALVGWQQAGAQGFSDGSINYIVTSPTTVEVDYQQGLVSGNVTLPSQVTYNSSVYEVTSISTNAFNSCAGLTSIAIPSSVTSIGDYAFQVCSGLTLVIIPSSVTSIGQGAFNQCSSLTSFTIPNSVISIGDYAFSDCYGLTSVTIPNSVTSIGDNAFQNCSSLTSVTIPSSVTSIGGGAFQNCFSLTSVTIPNSVLNIGDNAFQGCNYVTSVTIPASVTSIGDYAFADCYGLTSVICDAITPIPINSSVFDGVNLVNCSLTVPDASVLAYQVADVWQNFSPVRCANSIQNSTTVVSACRRYTWALNGKTYTESGVYMFTNANCITEKLDLTIDGNRFTYNGINYTVISRTTVAVGDNSGANGHLIIPATVTTACGTYSVTRINDSAFANNTGITSVTILNSATSIGEYAFYNCHSLTSVTIGSSVTNIAFAAFLGCDSLTSVTIGSSVTSIADYAFAYCNLTSVTCNATTPISIPSSVFDGVNQGACLLLVPPASIAFYETAPVWEYFSPITSNTTTYSTSWDYGTPTAILNAVIAGNYSTAVNITSLSLEVNGTAIVTIPSGFNCTVSGKVTVANTASLTFENNANLIQSGTTNGNSGNITIKRDSNTLKRLDYTLWSSPVTGTQTLLDFSPLTALNPTRFYTYNATIDKYTAATASNPFALGTGYLIRMPDQKPGSLGLTTPYYLGTETLIYTGAFTGKPNNGTIDLTGLVADKFYAVGNPYPSTISADAFLNGNATDGTLYFWRKTNATPGTAYATYTLAGGTGTAAGTGGIGNPNGTIQVGQGFIVKTGLASTALTFTNTMRTTNNDNQIFKIKKAADKSRIWLNLTNAKGAFSQAMIAYFEGATLGLDAGIDGKYFNDSKIALTSTIDAAEYTIQGRPAFDPSDVVALSFKTDVAGDYTIAIDAVDGLFAKGQEVYLIDNLTGKETDLKAGSYTFAAAVGEAKDRFSLKYQKTLKVEAPVFNENSVSIFRNNGAIYVKSNSKDIKSVQVYDVQGRLIVQQKNVNATTATINNLKALSQVLIVKVIATDNSMVSKKVLN